jgi:uncharacterized repeat protein (TIGR02543 family)
MAANDFEVGTVLPAGIIRMEVVLYNSGDFYEPQTTIYFNDTNWIAFDGAEDDGYDVTPYVDINTNLSSNYIIIDDSNTYYEGTRDEEMHAEIIIDFSNCSLSERTVSSIDVSSTHGGMNPSWEEFVPSGYSITFEENGGTSVNDLIYQTALPNPLPTPTKSGYTFVNWYYDSAFTQKATAGDTIEANTTLYAKWHNLGSLFTEIADAIREKESSSGTIRDVDFGERIKQIQGAKEEETKTVTPNFSSGNQVITPTSGKVMTSVTLTKPTDLIPENIAKDKNVCGVVGTSFIAIELTQAQYDALSTKDSNTYYLIVEE